VFHIHGADVPVSNMVVLLAMLLNLVSVSGGHDKDTLWGFIIYAPWWQGPRHILILTRRRVSRFGILTISSGRTREFRAPSDQERVALSIMRAIWDGAVPGCGRVASMVFAVGKEQVSSHRTGSLYEVLLRVTGPLSGGFIALYGAPETIELLDKAPSGRDNLTPI
jgi:lysyl-tRNA synthetase class 1